jgi:uncharacterized protein (UPF0548 family)
VVSDEWTVGGRETARSRTVFRVPRSSAPLPGPDVPLTYPEVGATRDRDLGGELPPGYHHVRYKKVIGRGEAAFSAAAETLLTWGMHRRSGLRVEASAPRAAEGVVVVSSLGIGPARLQLPCRVLYVVDTPRRQGLGYGTLPGHPECGEEAFVVRMADDGTVEARIVAFSRHGRWFTRLGGPIATQGQRIATARYAAALRQGG